MEIKKSKRTGSKVTLPIQQAIKEKNRELGAIIQKARQNKDASIAVCATLLGISRRRYMAMESGDATIGFAELQVLLDFLGIDVKIDFQKQTEQTNELFRDNRATTSLDNEAPDKIKQTPSESEPINLQFQPGTRLQMVVETLEHEDGDIKVVIRVSEN